jgi:hypothetical protein
LVGLEVGLENRRTSRENEVLLENLEARLTVSRPNVRSEVSQWMYGPKLGCKVQSMTGNFIFTSRPIALVSLF